MGRGLSKPCEDTLFSCPSLSTGSDVSVHQCVLRNHLMFTCTEQFRPVFCSPSLGSGWRVSRGACKHKTRSAGGPAVTPATANTFCVYSITRSVNPRENNVMKTSWMKSCCLWALERVHVPISLLPVIYLPPFASVHAETFQEAAAVTIFLCRCVLCGIFPRSHLSERWTWRWDPSCRSAPALPARTDSHTSCGMKPISVENTIRSSDFVMAVF